MKILVTIFINKTDRLKKEKEDATIIVTFLKGEQTMIGLIIEILIGALVGWVAGIIMKSTGGFVRNAIMGIIGGFVAGLLLPGWLGYVGAVIGAIVGTIVGAVIGFFVCRKVMENYLKKNPPINEEMIKSLMLQMGRKPSQKQINQIMKQMEKY